MKIKMNFHKPFNFPPSFQSFTDWMVVQALDGRTITYNNVTVHAYDCCPESKFGDDQFKGLCCLYFLLLKTSKAPNSTTNNMLPFFGLFSSTN